MTGGTGCDGLDAKAEALQALLKGLGRVAVGFSGGVDSTLLLRMALDTLGVGDVLAVIADTPSLPRSEHAEALRLAESMGVTPLVIQPNERDDPDYVANPPDRCYYCKKHLFDRIAEAARERGIDVVLDGNNADDEGDYRPGHRAAQELGVRSPLMEAGLTKAEIRALSARMGLPTADKPAMACLASRVPYGTPVTTEVLGRIERAETVLREAGFVQCRVRHHGEVARIEIPPEAFGRLLQDGCRERVVDRIKVAGYRFVALDLQGYRMGSMNTARNDAPRRP